MRWGLTTGSCATAASFAAARHCLGFEDSPMCEITLPSGERAVMEIVELGKNEHSAWASVIKDGGDDPDITHGHKITAKVQIGNQGIEFKAGLGVGVVTKSGLQIPPGEAAINPVPRQMIREHLLPLGPHWQVEISVEGGEEIALQTFNPRLGIIGGISILGTTGRVRPFSHQSQLCAIQCLFDVATQAKLDSYILIPGNYGERAARLKWPMAPNEAFIEVGNDWGFALEWLQKHPKPLVILGHPGKLAKFLNEEWDTHSSRSASALVPIQKIWEEHTDLPFPESTTVEGFFKSLQDPKYWGHILSQALLAKVVQTWNLPLQSLSLIDMQGNLLGEAYA